MSRKINRRQFLVRSGGVLAGLTIAGTFTKSAARELFVARPAGDVVIDRVPLGRTGLTVPRMAMGTGTVGGGSASNQTRLGQEIFTAMFRHGYERGLRFLDTAETYGSIPFAGRAIAGLPRENITVLTKMWTRADGSQELEEVRPRIEEYLRQLGTDYIDILLIHCMTQGNWNTTRTHHMEAFTKAKEAGLLRCVGVSCHNLDAVRTAATEPWVDVIMTRINPFGTLMDGPPEQVREAIALARANGKGVVGMKIFGEGKHVTEAEREQSIRHAIHEARVDAMTLGLQSIAQMDDAIDRVVRISAR
ncbi:MAG: aldo/keto reductase [Alistipes sp.]|jgi:aryl-alcohol dehydrogenase-like predicted oxidoreductase|nr:aldo/keto reductase [Alistipes sp.]